MVGIMLKFKNYLVFDCICIFWFYLIINDVFFIRNFKSSWYGSGNGVSNCINGGLIGLGSDGINIWFLVWLNWYYYYYCCCDGLYLKWLN